MIPKCRCCGIRPAENAGLNEWKDDVSRLLLNVMNIEIKNKRCEGKRKENEIFLSDNYGYRNNNTFFEA